MPNKSASCSHCQRPEVAGMKVAPMRFLAHVCRDLGRKGTARQRLATLIGRQRDVRLAWAAIYDQLGQSERVEQLRAEAAHLEAVENHLTCTLAPLPDSTWWS